MRQEPISQDYLERINAQTFAYIRLDQHFIPWATFIKNN